MKEKKPFVAGTLFVVVVCAFTAATANPQDKQPFFTLGKPLSIEHVTGNADEYHKKVIRTEGKISSTVKKKHFKGKDYTIFKMKGSEDGAAMLVYLRGVHTNLKKGNRLSINGRFYRERKYLKFIKLKNVLKARKFEVLG